MMKQKGIQTFIRVKKYDKDKKLIQNYRFTPSTYTHQMIQLLYTQLSRQAVSDFTDTSNVDQSTVATTDNFDISSGAGGHNKGIVVGTSNQAFDVEDFNLISKINHGNLTGELDYSGMSFIAPQTSPVASPSTWEARRTFTNNSGGEITIEEIGLIGNSANDLGLFERSLQQIVVADAEAVVIAYEFLNT